MSQEDKFTDEEIAMFEGAITEINITNNAREEDKEISSVAFRFFENFDKLESGSLRNELVRKTGILRHITEGCSDERTQLTLLASYIEDAINYGRGRL